MAEPDHPNMLWFQTMRLPYGEPTPWAHVLYWPGQKWPRVSRPEYRTRELAASAAFELMLVLAAYPGLTSNDLRLEGEAAHQYIADTSERMHR